MKLKKLLVGMENFKAKGDMDLEIKKIECNSNFFILTFLF